MNAQSSIEADPTGQLEAALAIALPTLEGVQKNRENAAFKSGGKTSKYADLGSVIEAIRPVAEHGVWFRQVLHEGEKGVSVETLYTGFGATISAGTLFMPSDKANAQGFGSALTYARRYALVTAFGLSTEDDDGDEGSKPQQRQQQAEPCITGEQLAKLEQLIPAAKLTPAKFNQTYSIARTSDLPASRFQEAEDRLNTRLAELAKRETNKESGNA